MFFFVPNNFRLVEFPLPRAKLSARFLPILSKEPQLLLSLYIRAAYGAEGYGRRDARHPFPSFLSFFTSFLPSQFPRTLHHHQHLNHLFLGAIPEICV